MRPPPDEEARRWLSQAAHVLAVATTLLHQACYAESCFHAEQVGQLALKAFLYGRGERFIKLHSVKELVEECAKHETAFQHLTDAGKTLDQYYIPTRYPDALAFPGLPYETYTERQAKDAVELATRIYESVRRTVGEKNA